MTPGTPARFLDLASRGAERRRRQRAGRRALATRRRRHRRHSRARFGARAALPERQLRHRAPRRERSSSRSAETSCSSSTGAPAAAVSMRRHRAARVGRPAHPRPAVAERRASAARVRTPKTHRAATVAMSASGRERRSKPLCAASRTSCPGSHTTRSCITSRRAASSNTPAAAGARAMYARDRSSCCSRSAACRPIRDLLLRVMRQQNPDGDWPQWFMFFERERDIRPGDSHGDIVFWPLRGARSISHRFGRRRRARRARALLRRARPRRGRTSYGLAARGARPGADREAGDSGHTRWRPTATATGTIRCSPPTRRCASACAAPGR